MKIPVTVRFCIQMGCAFAFGAFIAVNLTMHWFTDAANTSIEICEYIALQADTIALRDLERGATIGARGNSDQQALFARDAP